MRRLAPIAAFDVAAPLLSAAGFVAIGVSLGWPLWWVPTCAVLCAVVAQSMAVNFYLKHRRGVSVGSDAHGGGTRLAVAAFTAASLGAAALISYTQWWVPQHDGDSDVAQVIRMASGVVARDLVGTNGQAAVVAAGVEVMSPKAASVTVITRAPRAAPGRQVQALRVALVHDDGRWTVWEVSPIRGAPMTGRGSDGG